MAGDPGMVLTAVTNAAGNSYAAWRSPGIDPRAINTLDHFRSVTAIAEAAKFHAIFLGDLLNLAPGATYDAQERLDPVITLSALAGLTRSIGLIATSSTTYNDPFTVARQFASLDHLSGGRAGWNIVTSTSPGAAWNYGADELPEHDARYGRADEFVEVVCKLWMSWERDAIVADKAEGIYLQADAVHEINHKGAHFQVKGPLNVPRPPQGRPLLVQAGASPAGLRLAAKYADVIFTTQQDLEDSKRFVGAFRKLLAEAGRAPDSAKVLPGLTPIIGMTPGEAAELAEQIGDQVMPETAFGLMTITLGGLDLSGYDLDAPFPDLSDLLPPNAPVTQPGAVMRIARKENLTMRQVMRRIASSYGHRVVVGTPDMVADDMERWFVQGAVDGFNIMATDIPAGLAAFTEHVVPRLQDRGVFRGDYIDGTLRENLGVATC